ncbi:MAG: hypothetical protein NW223_08530 [Hyphomicrobiaceae bacterium]|nr:hypothetical protein [Hyphomicrobiaceae bacterium]
MRMGKGRIVRAAAAVMLGASLLMGGAIVAADQGFAQSSKKEAAPKAGKGEKVCRYKFPTGEKRAWVCKKEEPCCAWDAIKYVKCGSTITGCL